MKKTYLTLFLCLLVIAGGYAQNLSAGLKGGVNVAYINGYEEIAGDNVRVAYLFGAYAEVEISDKFSVQPEVHFSSQGAVYEDTEDNFGEEFIQYTDDQFILEYVNVPVMLKYYPVKGFNIQVGPQVGFLTTAKNEYKENGEPVTVDYKDSVKSTDFGLAVGFGYKTGFGLNIDARYIHGLADINDLQIGDNINNMVAQVTVGYSLLK